MSAPINARAASACASASAARSTSPGVPRQRRTDRSLRNRETSYIRLLRACLSQFLMNEARYSRLTREFPERAEGLFTRNEDAAKERYEHLTKLIDLYDKQ